MQLPAIVSPQQKHIGISLGKNSLRAIEVDRHGKISHIAEVQFSKDCFKGGVLLKKDEFIAAVKKLLETGKFSTKFVAVCFTEAHAYTREYTIPAIPFDEVREGISWHVKELFPFPENEIYFDWKLLEQTDKEYQVVVIAVQKKLIDPLVEVFTQVGLKPLSFEPGASVISRLLTFKPQEKLLIVEINRVLAYLTLVEREKSRFTTVINFSTDETPDSYLANIESAIAEINTYYKTKKILSNEPLKLILTGELASELTRSQLQKNTGYPVDILDTAVHNPSFNKAYAMAVLSAAPPDDIHTVNLLPTIIQQGYESQQKKEFLTNILLRILVVASLLLVISITAFISTELERQRKNSLVTRLSNLVSSQTKDTQKILSLNAQAKNIVSLSPLRQTPKDKLSSIEALIPEGIIIEGWSFSDSAQEFTFNGSAIDRDALLNFKERLEKSDEFSKINLPLDSLVSPKNVNFSIRFTIKK